jgi:hypothetical protein
MSKSRGKRRNTRRLAPVGILIVVLGLLLFAYFVRKAGIEEIVDGIERLGAGFLLVLAISSVRLIVRAIAWKLCFEGPSELRFRDAFAARVMGDALGNLVPLGSMVISEPAKAVVVRDRVPLIAAVSALAVENLFYSISASLFIFCGTIALLLSFSLPRSLIYASVGALGCTAVIISGACLIISKQWRFLTGALDLLHRKGVGKKWLEDRRERFGSFEDRMYGFYAQNRARFLPIMLLEFSFHMAGVLEIYVTLAFISEVYRPTLLAAFILESVNRIINIVFKFMPLRTGVDEAGTGLLAKVLGLGTTLGVTLAIIRKSRDIFWTAVGFALLIRRGFTLRSVSEETEAVANEVNAAGAAVAAGAAAVVNVAQSD